MRIISKLGVAAIGRTILGRTPVYDFVVTIEKSLLTDLRAEFCYDGAALLWTKRF